MHRARGFGLLELLVVVIVLVCAFAVLWLVSVHPRTDPALVECMHNVKRLVGLLEFVGTEGYPKRSGSNLPLVLVKMGELRDKDQLAVLFCPGDSKESLDRAGGPQAYANLDLRARANGHLTSYAGRRMTDTRCLVSKNAQPAVVLICDDSEDHHGGKGYVVGLSGGMMKWRTKVKDWGLDRDAKVVVGPDSIVEELRCLSAD